MHDKSFVCWRCHILHAHCRILFTAVLRVPVSCSILPCTVFLGMALNETDFNFAPDVMMTVMVGRRELQLNPFVTSGTYMSHLQIVFAKSTGIPVSHFSMLPSTLKYLYSVKPVRMNFPAKQVSANDTECSAAWVTCCCDVL